jgi:hypothetical protein
MLLFLKYFRRQKTKASFKTKWFAPRDEVFPYGRTWPEG